MTEPDLLPLSDCGGDWDLYLDVVHEAFLDDIDRTWLMYKGRRITSPKQPESLGRGIGFWHVISEGSTEEERIPDLRRCERVPWIRYIVENAHTHDEIDVWQNQRGTTTNILFWYKEEYLVIIADRKSYWILKTAYCTLQTGRKRALRAERDRYLRDEGG